MNGDLSMRKEFGSDWMINQRVFGLKASSKHCGSRGMCKIYYKFKIRFITSF